MLASIISYLLLVASTTCILYFALLYVAAVKLSIAVALDELIVAVPSVISDLDNVIGEAVHDNVLFPSVFKI